MDRIIQQGDCILRLRDRLPPGVKSVEPGSRGHVLAEGEATGHAHCMTADAGMLYEDAVGTLWLRVDVESPIVHEEHHAQTVAPGVYEVGRVREVDPFEKAIRFVAD